LTTCFPPRDMALRSGISAVNMVCLLVENSHGPGPCLVKCQMPPFDRRNEMHALLSSGWWLIHSS